MPVPSCTVRGCARPLRREAGTWACDHGHAFDVARAGHVNLLQPQDRRSGEPGDPAEVVAARQRVLRAGAGDALAATVVAMVEAHAAAGRLSVLDVGCGDGFFLGALAARRAIDACGLDLSSSAAQAAARAVPTALIVVANADRGLPWADGSFDAVLSITSRRPVAEMARVLKPDGIAVVAVPAEDDLRELREGVLGRADARDRAGSVADEMSGAFREVARAAARARVRLSAVLQRDVLRATYRGGRGSRQDRIAALREAEVTFAHDVLVFGKGASRRAP